MLSLFAIGLQLREQGRLTPSAPRFAQLFRQNQHIVSPGHGRGTTPTANDCGYRFHDNSTSLPENKLSGPGVPPFNSEITTVTRNRPSVVPEYVLIPEDGFVKVDVFILPSPSHCLQPQSSPVYHSITALSGVGGHVYILVTCGSTIPPHYAPPYKPFRPSSHIEAADNIWQNCVIERRVVLLEIDVPQVVYILKVSSRRFSQSSPRALALRVCLKQRHHLSKVGAFAPMGK